MHESVLNFNPLGRLETVCALPIWSSTVGSLGAGAPGAGAPGTCAAVSVRGKVSVNAFRGFVGIRISSAHHLRIVVAVHTLARELRDGGSQLLHQDVDALLNDDIGLKVADALDIDVKGIRLGIIIKGHVGVCGGLPLGVGRNRPAVQD